MATEGIAIPGRRNGGPRLGRAPRSGSSGDHDRYARAKRRGFPIPTSRISYRCCASSMECGGIEGVGHVLYTPRGDSAQLRHWSLIIWGLLAEDVAFKHVYCILNYVVHFFRYLSTCRCITTLRFSSRRM